jgi:general secretion pathway protein J
MISSDFGIDKTGAPAKGKGTPQGRNRGFTLLELLISLTIVAMIVVIIFGAFRVGVRAWEKGEAEVDLRQRERIVLDLIKRQLSSLCLTEVQNRDQQIIAFKGDPKSIAFASGAPLTPGSRHGLVYVKYVVTRKTEDNRERLAMYESSLLFPDRKTGTGSPEDDDFFELLSGMKSIVFEYLKSRPDEKESPWQESWDPEIDKGVPRAVRITLKENDKKAPVYVIAAGGA